MSVPPTSGGADWSSKGGRQPSGNQGKALFQQSLAVWVTLVEGAYVMGMVYLTAQGCHGSWGRWTCSHVISVLSPQGLESLASRRLERERGGPVTVPALRGHKAGGPAPASWPGRCSCLNDLRFLIRLLNGQPPPSPGRSPHRLAICLQPFPSPLCTAQ